MNTIDNIRELARFEYHLHELRKISKALHTQDENACNYGLTKRQETRVENLEKRAADIAEWYGLKAYHQGDPRGCSLYLIEEGMENSYHNGVCISY